VQPRLAARTPFGPRTLAHRGETADERSEYGVHAVFGGTHCEMSRLRFSIRLFDGFCNKDWDDAIGFVLVLLIRRVCFYRDIPESFSLD
jgi:hypothetical protein